MKKDFSITLVLLSVGISILFTIVPLCKAHAEIYRWVDEKGGVHFTDNPMNIPEKYREKAEVPELPSINTYEETYSPSRTRSTGPGVPRSGTFDSRSIQDEIERLKSQIEAKKDLIRFVEERQNLALNPLRNRIVPEEDLKLYEKYKKELPGDERKLEELENMLSGGEESSE